MEWQLADAKNKFSEVFTKAVEEGPQRITRRRQAVVVVSQAEYDRLLGKQMTLLEYLRSGPGLDGLDLERDRSPMREIEF